MVVALTWQIRQGLSLTVHCTGWLRPHVIAHCWAPQLLHHLVLMYYITKVVIIWRHLTWLTPLELTGQPGWLVGYGQVNWAQSLHLTYFYFSPYLLYMVQNSFIKYELVFSYRVQDLLQRVGRKWSVPAKSRLLQQCVIRSQFCVDLTLPWRYRLQIRRMPVSVVIGRNTSTRHGVSGLLQGDWGILSVPAES